jgi:ribosomal protein L37E
MGFARGPLGEVSDAELRCRRCSKRFLDATYLGEAIYSRADGEEPKVGVTPYRRVGKKEMEAALAARDKWRRIYEDRLCDDFDRRWIERDTVSSKRQRAVKLPCRRCGAKPDVTFARLLPPLQAGYREIHIGPGGEVVPVGVLSRRPVLD